MERSLIDKQTKVLEWGTDRLRSKGFTLQQPPEILLSTPWSTIIRFTTANGDIYLKQTPPDISHEPQIIQLLLEKFKASVPVIIEINQDLHCFLMKDAGTVLRGLLKAKFDVELLSKAINEYAVLQRSTENDREKFFALGVPDWRLARFPLLYEQMIDRADVLKADGLTDKELQILHNLKPKILTQCQLLSSYGIPETLGIPDFNDNNTLIAPKTKKLTFIDWGEAVITHPFFSIYNSIEQAMIHYQVKDADPVYTRLVDACLENWLGLLTVRQLLEAFNLSKQLRNIYSVLSNYRLMSCVDPQALALFYSNKPNRLANAFRAYIDCYRKI